MAAPPSLSSPSALTHTGPSFQVLHHYTRSDHAQNIIYVRTNIVGTFASFNGAQTAALNALTNQLDTYERLDLNGTVCSYIDLEFRGIITSMNRCGMMHPRDEFQIKLIYNWNIVWAPPMGGEYEQALFCDVENGPKPKPSVKLPSKNAYLGYAPARARGPDFPLERHQHWAQSRVPIFRRYDEGSFRRPSNPYSAEFPEPYKMPVIQEDEVDLASHSKKVTNGQRLNLSGNSVTVQDTLPCRSGHRNLPYEPVAGSNRLEVKKPFNVQDIRYELGELPRPNGNGSTHQGGK
ncbi:hypothetical protein P280DRAFT_483682 [Massarina eburnea CBS 473.64]|uniref:Uncharacterized protein n=1 Tax=Massarina eburnea CBS 473.64 TaxID=1395130 RepID=A0A6A6RMM1_9PLEO|nr:hypothetical protein P280DRAFT_483682 [Massarina eburnea CBS 473.64]